MSSKAELITTRPVFIQNEQGQILCHYFYIMGIDFLNHIVVADNGNFNYFSFREQDMLHPSERVFQIIDDTTKRKRAAVADRKTARNSLIQSRTKIIFMKI